jgi:glycosyltransferase involved in cell wall biosynthesis
MTQRPRILMIQTQLGYGGAETSFIRLANFLAQTMDVTVALFTNTGTYSMGHESLNVPIVLLDEPVIAPRPVRWLRRVIRVYMLKKRHDVTISFLSGPNLVNVLAGSNKRTVVSLRGSRFFDPVAAKPILWMFQYLFDPIIFQLAARIVPVSEGLNNEILRVAPSSVLKKVQVISPFVDKEAIVRNLAKGAPEHYQPLKGQKVIVGVGRLSVEKGFHHLIRIFARMAETQSGIKLLLVGNGPMMEELRAKCTRLGLAMDDVTPGVTSVLFAGYQGNVLPLMALGSVYAMASATEGFPNVLLEAMAAGLPVVAADTPWGARTVLSDQPAPKGSPYPTTQATAVEYGTLMPRIDLPEYEDEWVKTLQAHLSAPPDASQAHTKRLRDFDLAVVGEKWKRLIETIEAS